MRPLPVAPLAGTEAFILGAALIRGETLPVVDARRLLGSTSAAAPRRFVTLKVGDRRAALAVDEVLGVRSLEATHLGVLPPMLQSASSAVIEALGRLDEQLLVVLRAGKLVPASAWQAVEPGERP